MFISAPYMIRKLNETPGHCKENNREYDKYHIHAKPPQNIRTSIKSIRLSVKSASSSFMYVSRKHKFSLRDKLRHNSIQMGISAIRSSVCEKANRSSLANLSSRFMVVTGAILGTRFLRILIFSYDTLSLAFSRWAKVPPRIASLSDSQTNEQ